MKKRVYVIAVVVFFAIFAFSAWKLLDISAEYRRGEKEYERLEQYVQIPETVPATTQSKTEDSTEPAETQPAGTVWPKVDFAALQMINPDVVGWIYIEGTNVNYPIVQAKDNDYYQYRRISGEHNSSGSIFLDAKASELFQSRNNPLYGHNMKNGSMFADIPDYVDQEFYEQHPEALLLTPQGNYKVKIFSCYITDAWDNSWQIAFNGSEYGQWLNELQRRSYLATDVHPTEADRVLTFSTCTYETEDARLLVHGIIEESEG